VSASTPDASLSWAPELREADPSEGGEDR